MVLREREAGQRIDERHAELQQLFDGARIWQSISRCEIDPQRRIDLAHWDCVEQLAGEMLSYASDVPLVTVRLGGTVWRNVRVSLQQQRWELLNLFARCCGLWLQEDCHDHVHEYRPALLLIGHRKQLLYRELPILIKEWRDDAFPGGTATFHLLKEYSSDVAQRIRTTVEHFADVTMRDDEPLPLLPRFVLLPMVVSPKN